MVDRDQVYKEELDQRDLSIADLDGRSHHFAMILGRQCLQIRHQAKVSRGRKYTISVRYVRKKFVPYPELDSRPGSVGGNREHTSRYLVNYSIINTSYST